MTLNFSAAELDVLAEIRRAGAFRRDEDAIKGALFWYALFFNLDVHPDIFALALPAAMRARALIPEGEGDQGDLFLELV